MRKINRFRKPPRGADRDRGRTGNARASGEEGFALVVALLALIGVTALASAGYLLSNSDYRINQGHRAAVAAFYVTDAGLERYLGVGRIRTDTLQYTHPDGQASVTTMRLVDVDTMSSLYLFQSVGSHNPAEGGTARRTVSTVVIRRAAPFGVNAALTSPPGLQKNGVSGIVSGFDTANPADCGLAGPQDVAGLKVPPGGLTQNGGGGGKGKGKGGGGGTPPGFEGNPPIDESKPAVQMLSETGIDWGALTSGGYAEADYVYSQDGYPSFGSIPANEWPMIVIDQASFSVNPPMSGWGTLVLTGDFTINGSWTWDGIILVGGNLTSDGNNHVEGAVVTGLNLLTGGSVQEDQLGNGTWEYRYNSCNVLNALKGIGVPVEEPGTWFETL
ncbi:MAG: pilus assembly PilX N-terminal domain-containing protein [Gemmatimonadota bacterium]